MAGRTLVSSHAGPSCEPCRERKVRCNRKNPCSHCTRLQLSCIYKNRKRRSPLKPPARTSPETRSPSTVHGAQEPSETSNDQPTNQHVLERLNRVEAQLSDLIQFLKHEKSTNESSQPNQAGPAVLIPPIHHSRDAPMDRGNCYVDNTMFWEVLLNGKAPTDTSDPKVPTSLPSLSLQRPSTQCGLVATDAFGYQCDDIKISRSMQKELWSIYVQNFDPLIKVLHLPSLEQPLLNSCSKPHEANDSTVALFHAVSFAAVTTLSRAECLRNLDQDQTVLLRHTMQKMDDAFGRAQFLLRPNTHTLAALVIYLAALRTYDGSRTIWIMTGIALRIAESLGVHEDGSTLGLDPFETETRRRLWSQITSLDDTAPENHGFYSTVLDRNYTISLPRNIDDDDLSPQMLTAPVEEETWTEMSFSILNIDLSRQLMQALVTNRRNSYEAKEALIRSIEQQIKAKWLPLMDPQKPICHAADAWFRISILRSEFVLSLQRWLSNTKGTNSKYSDLPQSLFVTAIELLEYGHLLQSGELFESFVWFFQQHPQLYALFLVLRTLCASPKREDSKRAWNAVENYFVCLTEFEATSEMKGRRSCVWTVLGPLRAHAREAYTQAHQGEASSEPSHPSVSEHRDVVLGSEFDIQPSYSLDQLGDLYDFDNALAWEDFPEWFSMEI